MEVNLFSVIYADQEKGGSVITSQVYASDVLFISSRERWTVSKTR